VLFARALPVTATSVAALEIISSEAFDMQRGNMLTRSVQMNIQSPYWVGAANLKVVTGIYSGAFRNLISKACMAHAVLHRMHESNAVGSRRRRHPFVVVKSAALYNTALDTVASSVGTVRESLDVLFSEAFEISLGSGAVANSKQIVVWDVDDDDQRSGASSDALILTTPGTLWRRSA